MTPAYSYITNINNLNRAWQKVFRKGSVGGIDRISVTEFSLRADAEIAHLCADLTNKRYVPEPYMEVKVPKKDNEKRSLGLMTVRDKVVQQVITDALTPFFEPQFLPSSYAYRPNRGVPQAVKRVSDGIQHFQNKWVVRCDIDRFFDNIPHPFLERQIRFFLTDEDLIQLIMLCMGMGKVSTTGSKWQPSEGKGVAQGGILSPLLANLYLHQLDSFIKSLRKPVGYVRYADDFVVLAKEKNLADTVANRIVGFLTNTLGLALDEKEIKPISEGFLFLGLWFNTEGYRLNEAKQQELCYKIEDTLYFNEGHINPKFFEVVEGIRRYHGQLLAADEVWFFDNKIVEVAHKRLQEMPVEMPQKTKRAYLEKLDFLTPQYRQAKQQMAMAMCKPNAPIFVVDMPAPATPPTFKLPVSNADEPPPFVSTPPSVGEILPTSQTVKQTLPPDKAQPVAPKAPQKIPKDAKSAKENKSIPSALKPEADTPEGINIPHEINPQKLIAQKRREYEKREGASLELVINQPGVSLGLMKNRIMVKQQGQNLLKEPTANVRHISVMARGVSISSNFIQHCAERNIPIVFYDDNKPVSAIFATDNADSDLWLAQSDAYRNDKAVQIAKTIAEAKITNQGNVLKYFAKHSQRNEAEFIKNQDNILLDLEKCARLMQELPDKTPMDKLRLQIMAYEGNAAQSYWQQVKELVKDETDFEKREHQGAKDLMNMLLNYGYGILYGRMWSAAMNARLHPSVSFLHTPHKNKPTLVFDMVEEFRAPIVDRTIIALLNRQEKLTIEQGKLSYDTRRRLAEKIMERINTIENFRGQRIRVGDIMRLQAVSLAKFLKGETKAYKPYLMKW
jgi:CRISPR-associated endonuclease Cas1/group II intron reverse transcriptase/maturase